VTQLDELMRRNFVDYASYSILDRAIPDERDGLKPVQRRILHTLFQMNDGRYHKVANAVGETMKLHPHGDAAIGDALVVLANKNYFIDRQGNFGNILTGHRAAAARYIECRLTPLALEMLFNEPLTEFRPSYDGRNQEPVFLPSKLPVTLMLGTEGIAVGMATRILPHNLVELWEAQIELLEGKQILLDPDFPQGGFADVSEYDDGRGKVRVRAKLKAADSKRIVISEIPFSTTTESLIASIEAAIQKGRVKISAINDYTTDKVEIELITARGATPEEVMPQLLAYTDCSVSVNSSIVVIRNRRPVELSVSDVLGELTKLLREQIRSELEWEQRQLLDRKHWLTLEAIFVEQKVYRRIETAKTDSAVREQVDIGMQEHAELFIREMVSDDITNLLGIRIRRISAFDRAKNRNEIKECDEKLGVIVNKLEHLTRTVIHTIADLIDRYGKDYPRRTKTERFDTIDKKDIAQQSLKLGYDRKTGFLGTSIKADKPLLSVSEYDLVLGISNDGSYRIMTPPEKVLFTGRLIHCERFNPESGAEFTVVYRDKAKIVYGKRIHIDKFIRNREYELIKDKAGKVDLLLPGGETGMVSMQFAPAPRQRVRSARFDVSQLELTGTGARGNRLAPKPVKTLKFERSSSTRSAKAGPKKTGTTKTGTKKKASTKPAAAKPASERRAGPKKAKPPEQEDLF
jgi:topoisomerase-4 subunit A